MIKETKKFKSASVIIVAMTETDSLKQSVDTVVNTCRKEDLKEIILALAKISAPECIAVAEKLCEEYKDVPVKIMYQTRKFVGGAFQDAFDIAEGSHIVMLSADIDTDPNVVCRFIEKAKQYPDKIITATRWKKGGGFVGYGPFRKVCNFLFNRAIALFYFSSLSDMTYGFHIIPSNVAKGIEWEELKHPFYLETTLKPLRAGVKFVEIPAVWTAYSERQHANTIIQTFNYFKPTFTNRFKRKNTFIK